MSKLAVDRFVAAAAQAYRATGNAQAIDVARLLEDHVSATVHTAPSVPPAARHIDTILSASDLHPVARALGSAIKDFDWTEGDLPMPASFRSKYAFVTLIGEGTSIPDDRFYFGLYVQSPNAHYPSHWHRAEELYYVLSGTSLWQQGDTTLTPKPPGTLIHHAPDEPHVMQTHDAPLLAMWAWIGDLSPDTYRIVGD